MNPTKSELQEANCWFGVDVAGGPEMTAFKRAARWKQHTWARDQSEIDGFGFHENPRVRDAAGRPAQVCNGTRLTETDARAGRNFLSATIEDVVDERLRTPQPHQTLSEARLRGDLLSSMPMAFNLFGEAARNDTAGRALAGLLAPGGDGEVSIQFEWSPGRRDPRFTRDRTAFDVVLMIEGEENTTAVGIETKYHEHPVSESIRPDQYEHLAGIANRSGVFIPDWEEHMDGHLFQVWRDHLLALAMREHEEWGVTSRYVLVRPSKNSGFADLSDRYRELLIDGEASFKVRTIEELVDAAFAHDPALGRRFEDRYFW